MARRPSDHLAQALALDGLAQEPVLRQREAVAGGEREAVTVVGPEPHPDSMEGRVGGGGQHTERRPAPRKGSGARTGSGCPMCDPTPQGPPCSSMSTSSTIAMRAAATEPTTDRPQAGPPRLRAAAPPAPSSSRSWTAARSPPRRSRTRPSSPTRSSPPRTSSSCCRPASPRRRRSPPAPAAARASAPAPAAARRLRGSGAHVRGRRGDRLHPPDVRDASRRDHLIVTTTSPKGTPPWSTSSPRARLDPRPPHHRRADRRGILDWWRRA